MEKALLKPLLSIEDLVRFSSLEGSGGDSLRTLLQRGQEAGTEWPGFEHANIGPYIQKMLAAATPFKGKFIFIQIISTLQINYFYSSRTLFLSFIDKFCINY